MAKHNLSSLLFLLFFLTTTVSAALPPPKATPSSMTPATPQQDQQLNNIIDALIGAEDFSSWTNIISSADPTTFPLSATFFIPSDDFHLPLDPFIFPYHIVPQRLTFSDLRLLKPLSRLPTLLPGKSILVTNNSAANFTVDNTLLSHPDNYLTSTIAVHGIQNILDYSVYGGKSLFQSQSVSPPPPPLQPPPPPSRDLFDQEGEVTGGGRTSDAAACMCRELLVVFLVVLGVMASKFMGFVLVDGDRVEDNESRDEDQGLMRISGLDPKTKRNQELSV